MVDKMSVKKNINSILAQLLSLRLFSLYGLINLPLSFAQRAGPKVSSRDWTLSNQWRGEYETRSIWVKVEGRDGDKQMYLSLRSGWIS
jgi:hypothetical protein